MENNWNVLENIVNALGTEVAEGACQLCCGKFRSFFFSLIVICEWDLTQKINL